ncbi:hypothetical protein GWA97_13480 [Flavobacterium sp. LaA7.5]|nr:hypothetical protein [Flavobacterium salilacus subsp. altitudinum]
MVSKKDIFTLILLFVISVAAAFVFAGVGYFYISVIVMILFFGLKYYLKRNKKILPFVEEDFNELGFKLLSERILKLSDLEVKFEVKIPYISVNGLPIDRYGYIRKFNRTFRAKSLSDGLLYDITASIIKQWDGNNKIIILSKNKISENL